jgi:cholesterol oxidase
VLEAGRRFDTSSLPRTSWDVRRFLWAPFLGCFGIQRVHFLRDVVVLAGAGVGGGSLNYANTLYEPMVGFYDDRQWADLADWRSELAPHYDQAKRMLGATENPVMTPADQALLEVAGDMGVAASFRMAPVGVAFGPAGTPPGATLGDPYFAGAGPSRRSCLQCGECMTGCRHGAKNTLLTNYLYLAERAGAVVIPLTTARSVQPIAGGGWEVGTVATGWPGAWRRRRQLRAEHVVLAAGAFGTQQLLHAMVMEARLPDLSPRLGQLTRTNSESLLGAIVARRRPHPDFSRGVAITSSFHPEPGTHVEPVRYGRGSNMMGLFGTLLVDGPDGSETRRPGWRRLLGAVARQPMAFVHQLDLRAWSERTVIALVMQARDNSMTVSAQRRGMGGYRLTTRQGHGQPNPTWLPVGHDVARRLAAKIGGGPSGTWGEIFGVPMTAHFLGGCAIGASASEGVIDQWHRVFGYPGLHVVDGSAMPANPGVNPSLTITAMAERAFAYWPNRGETDPRPAPAPGQTGWPPPSPARTAPGATPAAPAPVPPRWPVVPAGAPGELRPAREPNASERHGRSWRR